MNNKYKIISVYEVYSTDGGGMGWYTKHCGFFTSFNVAKRVQETNPFFSIVEFNAIKIGNDVFILNERHHGSRNVIYETKKLSRAKPVNVDVDTDELRREELLSKMSEDDKRILGL